MEPAGRRVCQKRLFKTLAKTIQTDLTNVQTKPTVSKKHELFIEESQESPDKASEREELDDRTTQILEEELQAVMMKVWQALPDNPASAADKYVAETLRNEASDDIRNVLGLNVTKRLLNVFNPLYIRAVFSSLPTFRDLRRFEKEHALSELTPLAHGQHAYAARVRHVADFDRLCGAKFLRCGDVSVTVHPKYRFYDCPLKLNSGFIKKIKTTKAKKGEDSTNVEKEATDKKTTESNEKIVQQTKTNSEKKNESENSKVTVKNNINKVVESNQNKGVQSAKNIEVNNSEKKNNITHNKVTDLKPKVVKETHTVGQVTTQSNAPKLKPNQVTQEATTVKNVNVEKTSTLASASKPKPNQASQEVVATKNVNEVTTKLTAKTTTTTKPKPNQVNKEVVATKKVTDTKPKAVEKTTAATNPGVATKKLEPAPKSTVKSDVKPNVVKPKPKQVNKEVVVPRKVVESKPRLTIKNVEMINSKTIDQEDEMNDDEEMNDEEILALISSGVVVDECSGSDEE